MVEKRTVRDVIVVTAADRDVARDWFRANFDITGDEFRVPVPDTNDSHYWIGIKVTPTERSDIAKEFGDIDRGQGMRKRHDHNGDNHKTIAADVKSGK